MGHCVLVQDYRIQQSKWSEGTITQVLGPLTYQVYLPDTQTTWKRHVDQLVHCPGLVANSSQLIASLVAPALANSYQEQLPISQEDTHLPWISTQTPSYCT